VTVLRERNYIDVRPALREVLLTLLLAKLTGSLFGKEIVFFTKQLNITSAYTTHYKKPS